MAKNFIIANWKMSLGHEQTLDLVDQIVQQIQPSDKTEIVVCPSFISLVAVAPKIANSGIKLGAQDCFWHDEGAFTGEVSPLNLKEIGCDYVIVGHSERRGYLNETDAMVRQKVKAALENNLVPIICVGETLEQRQSSSKDFIIMQQVNKALAGIELTAQNQLIIPYEPVWVIGSGQAVEPSEAEHTTQVIRQVLLDYFPLEVINKRIHLLYGGSVNPLNIREFLSQPTIVGALVGGASLEAKIFWQLIKALE